LLLGVFVAAIVFTGIYPKPMLNRIEPSVNKLIEHVELRTDYQQPVSKGEVHGEAGE
jgi:NADH-quinone oxidoreductase subunit M